MLSEPDHVVENVVPQPAMAALPGHGSPVTCEANPLPWPFSACSASFAAFASGSARASAVVSAVKLCHLRLECRDLLCQLRLALGLWLGRGLATLASTTSSPTRASSPAAASSCSRSVRDR